MTEITHPVRRSTRGAYNVLYASSAKARPIVVAILPGDVLEFREKGRRGRWYLAVDSAFQYAVRCKINADRKERANARRRRLDRH